MGIDFICNDVCFRCSYGHWNDFKRAVLKASYLFIKNRTFDLNEYSDADYFEIVKQDLLDLFENNVFDGDANEYTNLFVTTIEEKHYYHLDNCIYFDIAGLYALCNKSDCDGYYSVGNSYDICVLFEHIGKYLVENETDMDHESNSFYCTLRGILPVFEESVKTKNRVTIC